MGVSKAGDSELIRITVIDYFTTETLIDRLVWPDAELLHPNTQYSGVTWGELNHARRTKTCLFGIENARKAIWNFVRPDTVIVAHGGSNDFRSLRWIHTAIVDSYIVEWIIQTPIREAKEAVRREEVRLKIEATTKALKEKAELEEAAKKKAEKAKAEGNPVSPTPAAPKVVASIEQPLQQKSSKARSKGTGDLALKTLTLAKLGRNIQNAGKAGHDSLEDAIAARDLVHWYMCNPTTLGIELEKLKNREVPSLLD